MDYRPPYEVAEALRSYAGQDISPYPDEHGLSFVREAIAGFQSGRGFPGCSPGHVIFVPSIRYALSVVCSFLLQPNDRAIFVGAPAYGALVDCILATGATVSLVELRREDGWGIDVFGLIEAMAGKPKVIFLNNPHNPSGYVLSAAEMQLLFDMAAKHDCWLVSDEVYEHLVLDGSHMSGLAAPEALADKVVAVSGFGKSFNTSGYRGGYLVHKGDLVERIERSRGNIVFLSDTLSQIAAMGCINAGDGWLVPLRTALRERRDTCGAVLNAVPGILCRLPAAGFLAWVEVRSSLPSDVIAGRILQSSAVQVWSGSRFAGGERGAFRINFGTDQTILETALERLSNALSEVVDT
jgi:aspartate/methionine/tyrosine aminotransferase